MTIEATFDKEGYPTESFLEAIENCKATTPEEARALMEVIQGAWNFGDWGWSTEVIPDDDIVDHGRTRYHISTGGWSGNESIIYALKANKNFFWTIFWESSRRGGHFTFVI